MLKSLESNDDEDAEKHLLTLFDQNIDFFVRLKKYSDSEHDPQEKPLLHTMMKIWRYVDIIHMSSNKAQFVHKLCRYLNPSVDLETI